ncbi:MAG: metallopeptidase TldD-related protein [Myxococcota bacterium]
MNRGFLILSILLAPLAMAATPDNPRDSVIVEAMQDEMERTKSELALEDFSRPYYVSFSVFDVKTVSCTGQNGGLLAEDRTHRRFLRADVRVGSYESDNSNSQFQSQFFSSAGMTRLPSGDDYHALRRSMWLTADSAYKAAVESLEKKRAEASSLQANGEDEDVPSFTKREGTQFVGDQSLPVLEDVECADLVERVSAAYGDHEALETGQADAVARNIDRYFIDTEGSFVFEPSSHAYIEAWGRALAEDGMPVKHMFDHVRRDFSALPAHDDIIAEARASAELIAKLRKAEKVDTYTGPVVFTEDAATQIMWRMLGNDLSGTPPPTTDFDSGSQYNALRSRLNRRVFPKEFNVVDDPTKDKLGDIPLMGSYEIDHEGVPAQKVELINDGMLETLLMSRTPSDKIAQSNGHGRGGWQGVEGTVGNLIIQPTGGQTPEELKTRLLEEAKREGLDHGYIVRQFDNPWVTQDALTSGDSWARQSKDRMPATVVVRVNADGSEELVRGLSLEMPLIRDLEHIVGWGKQSYITNYIVTGTAGYLQSIAAPAVLFEELDMPAAKGPFARPHEVPAP